MARLEAAFAETVAALEHERSKKATQRVRLLANPLISVSEIQTTLESYTRHCKSSNLYSLICPPASLAIVTWQTPPSGPWLSKVAPLLYDLLDFCPNTKLQHSKLSKALVSMQLNHSLELQQKMTAQDAMDQISLCIRIVLSMLRQVKINETQRNRIMRGFSNEEQAKLNMVLKKVVLPVGYVEDQEKCEEAEECQAQQLDLQPCLAMVPYKGAGPETKTAERQPETQPALKGVANAFSKSLYPLLRPLPSIFSKILNKSADTSHPADAAKPVAARKAAKQLQDEDLLKEAMSHVPKEVKEAKLKPPKGSDQKKTKKKKNQTKKKGKASKQSKDAKPAKDKKKEKTENTDPAPDVPMYHVQEYPSEADTYRNLYVSRHHNRAKALALQGGLCAEDAKERGRKAAKEASALWSEVRG